MRIETETPDQNERNQAQEESQADETIFEITQTYLEPNVQGSDFEIQEDISEVLEGDPVVRRSR